MSRQFSFYLTSKDFLDLENRLQEAIGLTVLAEESLRPRGLILPSLKIKKMGKENLAVYLARQADLDQIRLEPSTKSKMWFIDVLLSPAIEVRRCYHLDGNLRAGRMYYTSGFYLNNGSWQDKDPDFLEWAARIFKTTKKNLIRNEKLGAYFGENAKDLLQTGKIKLLEP